MNREDVINKLKYSNKPMLYKMGEKEHRLFLVLNRRNRYTIMDTEYKYEWNLEDVTLLEYDKVNATWIVEFNPECKPVSIAF